MRDMNFCKRIKLLLGAVALSSASASALELNYNLDNLNLQAQSTYLYDFPFKGEDFGDYEKLYTFEHADTVTQKHGFDISGRKYNLPKTKWSRLKGDVDESKNENRAGYNKPIYAMRDGVVAACWRSAPENPRVKNNSDYKVDEQGEYLLDEKGNWISKDEREWIHWRLRDHSTRSIPKAGNHLIIQHDDGTYALYAHMIPGTIPFELCPRNASTFVEAGIYSAPEDDWPTVTGISPTRTYPLRVEKGQRIGRMGNSGESTGPHLHVHVAKGPIGDAVAEPIKFKRGMVSLLDHDDPYGDWQSFKGSVIPTNISENGILVWAPRSLSAQYVRHGFASPGFSALFDHLSDSGFKLSWFDGFTSGSTTRYNQIWKPADTYWRAYSRKTSSGYQSVFNQAKADGYVPVHVDSYNTPYGVRYAAIFEKKSMSYIARHGLTYQEHMNTYNEAKSKGMSPVSISVVSTGGQRRYTVLYHKKYIGAWSIRSQMTSSQYNQTYADMKAANKYPVYLNAYMHDGTAYYTAVFASKPVSNAVGAKHGLTASGFQSYYNSYSSLNYLTSLIAGLDGYGATRYAGVWRR